MRVWLLGYGVFYVVLEMVGHSLETVGWGQITALDVATAVTDAFLTVSVVLAVLLGVRSSAVVAFGVVLVIAGLGVALVQTPSLSGATRSPAGQKGAGLGLFNMMRFVGASVGAAGVAAAYPDHLGSLFAGCAAIAVLGLVLSFSGRELPDRPSAPPAAVVEAR